MAMSDGAELPLRLRAKKSSTWESDTVYGRGFSRHLSEDEVVRILSVVASPAEVDLSRRQQSGVVWARYEDSATAHETILAVHQSVHSGVSLSLRFELGVDERGKPIVARTSHNTVIRHLVYKGRALVTNNKDKQRTVTDTQQPVDANKSGEDELCSPCSLSPSSKKPKLLTKKPKESIPTVNYTHKSVIVNGSLEIPFPSGLYFSRLLSLVRTHGMGDSLVALLTDASTANQQNKHAKEVSEAMAMCDAVERVCKLVFQRCAQDLKDSFSAVRVYVLGDGKFPLSAAALCLSLPDHWEFFSVDPLLQPVEVDERYRGRFHLIPAMSQDFCVPATPTDEQKETRTLSIIVACHSHAPLLEFWSRVNAPKISVAMPCCADYSELPETPLFEFEDFEVYSAKRRIKIHASLP